LKTNKFDKISPDGWGIEIASRAAFYILNVLYLVLLFEKEVSLKSDRTFVHNCETALRERPEDGRKSTQWRNCLFKERQGQSSYGR
jgi:hypothetical protein